MRWFWAIVLAGLLATAGFLPRGMAHDHGADIPVASALAPAAPDHCAGQEQTPDPHHKGCCAGTLCGFVVIEAFGSGIADPAPARAVQPAVCDTAPGRNIPPETGPPRARA